MSENVITLSLNPSRLSAAGQKAFQVLIKECVGMSNQPGSTPVPYTAKETARAFYKYVRKHNSQRAIVDLLIEKAVATYAEVKKAAGHPAGGAPMAGVLSSITRNWQRASSDRSSKGVIKWDDFKERYYLEPAALAELREAKAFFTRELDGKARVR